MVIDSDKVFLWKTDRLSPLAEEAELGYIWRYPELNRKKAAGLKAIYHDNLNVIPNEMPT